MRIADTIDLHDKSGLTPAKKQELKDGILRIIDNSDAEYRSISFS